MAELRGCNGDMDEAFGTEIQSEVGEYPKFVPFWRDRVWLKTGSSIRAAGKQVAGHVGQASATPTSQDTHGFAAQATTSVGSLEETFATGVMGMHFVRFGVDPVEATALVQEEQASGAKRDPSLQRHP